MPKRSIRQKLLKQRRSLDGDACLQYSHQVQQKLLATEHYRQAKVIALYAPIHNEVLTNDLFDAALQDNKRVCFPRVEQNMLQFLQVDEESQLAPGAFGVDEPTGTKMVPIDEIDLVVVPGVAFDRSGYRLGYGQGYYDRAVGSADNAVLAGLAFDFQIVDELPTEEHDVRLDLLVTGSGVLAFN